VTAQLLALLTEIPVAGRQVHDANMWPPCWSTECGACSHNTMTFVRFAAFMRCSVGLPAGARAPPSA